MGRGEGGGEDAGLWGACSVSAFQPTGVHVSVWGRVIEAMVAEDRLQDGRAGAGEEGVPPAVPRVAS